MRNIVGWDTHPEAMCLGDLVRTYYRVAPGSMVIMDVQSFPFFWIVSF